MANYSENGKCEAQEKVPKASTRDAAGYLSPKNQRKTYNSKRSSHHLEFCYKELHHKFPL